VPVTAGGLTIKTVTAIFEQEISITQFITAANPTVTGGSVGVVIDSDSADLTVGTGGNIKVSGEDAIVVGTEAATAIKMTKATLGTGTYTSGEKKLGPGSGAAIAIGIAEGGIINIAVDCELELTSTSKVTLASPAIAQDSGAKLTGAGKLTAAGDTWISGSTGAWEATVANIDIESTGTAGQSKITGTAGAVLKGGMGATITQKAVTNLNSLTLTTVTVDVSTEGSSIVLEAASSNPGTLKLAATGSGTTGIVKTATAGSASGYTTDITEIDGAGIGTFTIANGAVTWADVTNVLGTLEGGSNAMDIVAGNGNTDTNVVLKNGAKATDGTS
jgi:hypothetical protein